MNAITLKNKHPLPLIQTLLDLIVGFWFFTKLDIIAAYNSLQIQKSDEWKTAFCCRYRHFKYKVIPFGLVNASAAFQAYINLALREYTNVFVLAYLDNVLIFSKKEEDHVQHIQLVLEKLREFRLFVKLSKYVFSAEEIEFLGFIINRFGIQIDPSKLYAIATWPMPKSFQDI